MGLRTGRKEHDNEQGNTEVDDGSRGLRRSLRNGYGGSQRQSSAQGQGSRCDESARAEVSCGESPDSGQTHRSGTGESAGENTHSARAPGTPARGSAPCRASSASGKASCAETPSQSHPPHGGLVRNRCLAPRRSCRRADRSFNLTANTQPQTKKGTTP